MGFCIKWKPKYLKIDPINPSSFGFCDTSGFAFNHKDLVKQMEWVGDNKVWTGEIVGKPFEDKLNEQNRPPLVKDDPKVVKNPRPPYPFESNNNIAPSHSVIAANLKNHHWGGTDNGV